jgi:AcrR family transcriptional regulator
MFPGQIHPGTDMKMKNYSLLLLATLETFRSKRRKMQTKRQQEIIQKALRLIHEKGIQGLTIKNLSNELVISEPAIYRHFENKTQILVTILDSLQQNSAEIFEEALKKDKGSISKIEFLFERYFLSFSRVPSLTSVIFSEEVFRNEPKLISKIAEIIGYNNKILLTILKEGQQNNEIRNDVEAEHLAIVIMGTLRLFVKKWQFSEFSFNIQEEGRKIIESIKLMIAHS